MSNQTMQAVYDAAGAFRQDTQNLPALEAAIAAHRADEAPKPKRTRKPKEADSE